jgi:DNA modification methylase
MQLDRIIDTIGIEPYHREPAGCIFHADCLDILPLIPEKSVDLVVTDPPYNVSGRRGVVCKQKGYKALNEKWDSIDLDAVREILPDNALVFCSYHSLNDYLNWKKPRQVIHWHKNNAFPALNQFYDFSVEYILWYCGDDFYFDKSNAGRDLVITNICGGHERTEHPTQKPVGLISQLVRNHSPIPSIDDVVICDPFLGSGTTAVAAKQLGRKFIGIEIEEKYCKIAVDRLRQEELFSCAV